VAACGVAGVLLLVRRTEALGQERSAGGSDDTRRPGAYAPTAPPVVG